MRIAVASGKGGTGKTTVATSLAESLADEGGIRYVDCDVEAPNGHLFLQPEFHHQTNSVILVPEIDPEVCTLCGKCVQVCQFHALVKIGKQILVFPQLCHGCGSCTWNCPTGAIREIPNKIGVLETGVTQSGIEFHRGMLSISEPMATPVIRQIKKKLPPMEDFIDIFDAPPGASCSVVETLRGMDFVLLVTEPTPFGLHDLKQIVEIVREMKLPAGVIINRDGMGNAVVDDYCRDEHLPVLMRIPFEREIAAGLAVGKTLIQIHPEYRSKMHELIDQIEHICSATRVEPDGQSL